MNENDTVIPKVFCVDGLPFWPVGTNLACISITADDNGACEIPFPERQPFGNSWIETDPAQTEYYCLDNEKDTFIKYFLDRGCYIGTISSVTKRPLLYDVSWTCTTTNDALMDLIKNDSSSECRLVYHQKSLNIVTGELATSNIQNISRECDSYYNFKNISAIRTTYGDLDPSLYTKENPLILDRCVETKLLSDNPENAVSYNGIFYLPEERMNLKQNIIPF